MRDVSGRNSIILGTGLVALDVIIGPDLTQPPILMAGGTCANVLAILSYLGWDSFPIARLNGDSASQRVRRDLLACGVSLEFATQRPTVETPVIVQTIRRDRNGLPKHRFSLVCPDCGAWYPSYRAVTEVAASEVLATIADVRPSGFSPRVFFFDRVSRGALTLAESLSALGALIVFEPVGTGDPKLFEEALALTDILKYSRDRLPDLSARRRRSERVVLEIETHGSAGLRYRSSVNPSWAWHTSRALPAPTFVDAAGAGDWCTAAIVHALGHRGRAGADRWSSDQLADAVRYGQAAAAIACAYSGARGAMYALNRATFDRALDAVLHEASEVPVVFSEGRRVARSCGGNRGKKRLTLCAICA
jgi:fructokinase